MDVYKVNVQNMRKIAQIFVCFSESLNFKLIIQADNIYFLPIILYHDQTTARMNDVILIGNFLETQQYFLASSYFEF